MELKISRIPVLSAYEQLLSDGYLQAFGGAGTCVARSIPEDVFRPVSQTMRRASQHNRPRRISRHLETAMSIAQFPDTAILGAFRTCLPALDQFPIGVWSSLLARHSRDRFQAALNDFIRESHFARHIRRMRLLYKQRCETLTEAIRSQMGAQLEIISADGGMHLAGLLPADVDDTAVSRKAADIGVSANPMSTCYLEHPKRSGLILGFGATDTAQIKEGVQRLATVVKEVAASRNGPKGVGRVASGRNPESAPGVGNEGTVRFRGSST